MFDLYSFDGAPPDLPGVEVINSRCSKALTPSRLPDLDFALNPYKGCQHGCLYCYSPYVLNLPPGEWGRRVEIRSNLPNLLVNELKHKTGTIGLGTITDPYQPVEKFACVTRKCLEVMLRSTCQICLHTKSDLITRDLDILERFRKLEVGFTLTTGSDDLAALLEPAAPPPSSRFKAIRKLTDEGMDVFVMVSPIIPMVTDSDLLNFAERVADTGVKRVIVDRLRLRKGMLDRIINKIREKIDPAEFCRRVKSESYIENVEGETATVFECLGLEVEMAFQGW